MIIKEIKKFVDVVKEESGDMLAPIEQIVVSNEVWRKILTEINEKDAWGYVKRNDEGLIKTIQIYGVLIRRNIFFK